VCHPRRRDSEEKEIDMNLVVTVRGIKGTCPVYAVGDRFALQDGYRLVADKPLCMHSLASLMPHYNALRVSDPVTWGLAGKDDPTVAYIQCLDPVGFTGGGTVTFEIAREGMKECAGAARSGC
jgi:uncharacterized repeat protein (TIGR04076 family)